MKDNKNIFERLLLSTQACFKRTKRLSILHNHTVEAAPKEERLLLRPNSRITFVTIEELVKWTNEFIRQLPVTFDIIVGIPRSGMLVASIIALKLGKPLTTPELLKTKTIWKEALRNGRKAAKILLVDDSASVGSALVEAYLKLKGQEDYEIATAVIIATSDAKSLVNHCYKVIDHPRIFEWNLMHSKKGKLAADLDGVVCVNPPENIEESEEKYLSWLKHARPQFIPSFEIDAIISCRLEKYRRPTEEWLENHHVRYKELILWDLPSSEHKQGSHAAYKAELIKKINPDYIWESSLRESQELFNATGIPTLCVDCMVLLS